jgi:hypothetical protein
MSATPPQAQARHTAHSAGNTGHPLPPSPKKGASAGTGHNALTSPGTPGLSRPTLRQGRPRRASPGQVSGESPICCRSAGGGLEFIAGFQATLVAATTRCPQRTSQRTRSRRPRSSPRTRTARGRGWRSARIRRKSSCSAPCRDPRARSRPVLVQLGRAFAAQCDCGYCERSLTALLRT